MSTIDLAPDIELTKKPDGSGWLVKINGEDAGDAALSDYVTTSGRGIELKRPEGSVYPRSVTINGMGSLGWPADTLPRVGG